VNGRDSTAPPSPQAQAADARSIAAAFGSHNLVQLDQAGVTLMHAAAGRQFAGPVYVATPALLKAFGISAAQVNPAADVLTMRPGPVAGWLLAGREPAAFARQPTE